MAPSRKDPGAGDVSGARVRLRLDLAGERMGVQCIGDLRRQIRFVFAHDARGVTKEVTTANGPIGSIRVIPDIPLVTADLGRMIEVGRWGRAATRQA